jgi:hypothetical protein
LLKPIDLLLRSRIRNLNDSDPLIALIIAAGIALSGCSNWADAQRATADGYTVFFRTTPSPPRVGQPADLAVRITDAQGRPARTCRVAARQFMPGMEMSTDEVLIDLARQGNGVYGGRSHEFSMGGDWQVAVNFDCAGKPLEAKFEFHLDWPE